MRRTWVACLAGVLIIMAGGAASSQEKRECFLREANFAFPISLISSDGRQTVEIFNLVLKDEDFIAVTKLKKKEGIRGGYETKTRVYLFPSYLTDLSHRERQRGLIGYRTIRFPGSLKIYFANKNAVYCKP